MVPAVQSPDSLSELADGLAGGDMIASDAGAIKRIVADAAELDALADGGVQERGRRPAPRRNDVAAARRRVMCMIRE